MANMDAIMVNNIIMSAFIFIADVIWGIKWKIDRANGKSTHMIRVVALIYLIQIIVVWATHVCLKIGAANNATLSERHETTKAKRHNNDDQLTNRES